MNNTSAESLKISLIDTKTLQQKSKSSFCHKFNQCLFGWFFKRSQFNDESKDQSKNSIYQSYDEKPHGESLETNFDSKNASKFGQKSFFTKYKVENFPQNEIFLLEGASTKKPILVKITEKNFEKIQKNQDLFQESTPTVLLNQLENEKTSKRLKKIPYCFPIKSDKIQYNIEYLHESNLPHISFSEYMASKIQGNLILDFTGGIGEYTIPISRKSDYILCCSNDTYLTEISRKNCNLYRLNNIEFINFPEEEKNFKEFLTLNNKKNLADLIFVNPSNIIKNFSSKKIYDVYLKKMLKYLSYSSKSLVLVLPKHFQNFEGLADLFANSLKRGERCGIEIEKIFESKKLKHLVVYYGLISTIKGSEEMAFIHNIIEKYEGKENNYSENLKNNFRSISNQISHHHGNMLLLEIIANTIKEFVKDKNRNIYSYILNIFKKYSFNFSCNEIQKNCGHELGMIKSYSSNLEKNLGKSIVTKTNSSTGEEQFDILSGRLNKKSEGNIEKSDNHKNHNKIHTIESFNYSDNNEIISDYSKSFQENIEYDEYEDQNTGLKKMKRCESGVQNSFSKNESGAYFNSLNEKSLI